MTFYKWSRKLLVREEFLTPEDRRRGVTKRFAVSEQCCCPQWFCVLTDSGDYECRDERPAPDENAQVLSEHKDEQKCLEECYERYYCVDRDNDYQCLREGEVTSEDDIIGGPYRLEECEVECNNCPPCGDAACEADAAGDSDIIAQCCAALEEEEEWTYDGDTGEWSISRHCGDDRNTPCSGDTAAGFPDDPEDGDTVTFPCAPNGNTPTNLNDCKKCLFDCDKTVTPYDCVRAPDTGLYTEKECERECAGLWYCVDPAACERQNPPKNPAKQGYETETECLEAAAVDCQPPDCHCMVPAVPVGMRLELKDDPVAPLCIYLKIRWEPPADCEAGRWLDEIEWLDEGGNVLGGQGGFAVIGEYEPGYCSPLASACEPTKRVAAARVRIKDSLSICPPTEWRKIEGFSPGSPSYEDLCPPPPGGYICQGPFSGIWECAPCYECAGQEVYATLEECQAACKPPPDCFYKYTLYEWQMITPTMSRWTIVFDNCTAGGCQPGDPPPSPGNFPGERQPMWCGPPLSASLKEGENPLP